MILNNFEKDVSGCGLFGVINRKGRRRDGTSAIKAIRLMHERSNGLGGGFAAYGIYPKHKENYAFHMIYSNEKSKELAEEILLDRFSIEKDERIPTAAHNGIQNVPILWRYFLTPKDLIKEDEEEMVVKDVMRINAEIEGAFVMSSGKNMGIFKAVGYPEDVGEFYKLEDYEGYSWTVHGRFPTNTPGWWGGAHPFGLLDWSIVHNGEISSYGTNKRYLEMMGYKCSLMTDTEVVTYLFDLLLRKHKLPLTAACKALASPLWKDIDSKGLLIERQIRTVYPQALLNGPFSVILGHKNGLVGLNDRIKLRPLVAGIHKDNFYISSEESSIREVCASPEKVWSPRGGEPVIATLENDS